MCAPGYRGEAAQLVQPGARGPNSRISYLESTEPVPTRHLAARSALPPRAGEYISGSSALRQPHLRVPPGSCGGRNRSPRVPWASPARLEGRRLSGPAPSRGLAGARGSGTAERPLRKPSRWSPKPSHKSFMSGGRASRAGRKEGAGSGGEG